MTEWEQRFADGGYRITVPRRAVMEVLLQAEVPLSPQEIFEQGGAIYPRLGLVTVYRTLRLAAKLDLVRRVHRGDGCHAYVSASPGHHHVVICQVCGRAAEFAGGDDLRVLVEQVEARTGYSVDGHLLQLSGLCLGCHETGV